MKRIDAFHEASFFVPIAFAFTAWDAIAWTVTYKANDHGFMPVAAISALVAFLLWATFFLYYIAARQDFKTRKERFKEAIERGEGTSPGDSAKIV